MEKRLMKTRYHEQQEDRALSCLRFSVFCFSPFVFAIDLMVGIDISVSYVTDIQKQRQKRQMNSIQRESPKNKEDSNFFLIEISLFFRVESFFVCCASDINGWIGTQDVGLINDC